MEKKGGIDFGLCTVVGLREGKRGRSAFRGSSLGLKTIGQTPLRLVWMTESSPVTIRTAPGTGGVPGGREPDTDRKRNMYL